MGTWAEWHEPYDDPRSPLSRRLAVVQRHIRDALDDAAPGPIRLISVCAGQGRDVAGALDGHRRGADVAGRLVELDPDNAAVARSLLEGARVTGVEVITGDASTTAAYAGAVPADIVLVCGVFGNVSDDDIRNTIELLPTLCRVGATVIWTRHRFEPDLTPTIRRWFAELGFDEVAFDAPGEDFFGVGANRLTAPPRPSRNDRRLFTFLGEDGPTWRARGPEPGAQRGPSP